VVCVLGIDPGLDGALASYDGENLLVIEIQSFKSKGRGRELDWEVLHNCKQSFSNCTCTYLEKVGSRPGEGVSSAFKFGSIYGGLYTTVLGWYGSKPKLVLPQVWERSC
jgi:crossover junction endodeoxyribonuclease RuvC